MQFSNVDLDQCLGELFGLRRLEGKGNLAFAIESEGASVYELTKALNGTADLFSRKGAITGLNVEHLLRRIERRPLSGAAVESRRWTSVQSSRVSCQTSAKRTHSIVLSFP